MHLPPALTHLRPAVLIRFLLGILLPLIVIGLIAEDVLEKQRFAFEQPVMLWVHAHATPALTGLSLFLHTFGGPLPMGVVFIAIVLGLWFTRRHSLAVFALLGLGSSVGFAFAMKLLFNRPRPELWTRLVVESGASFPSGHSTVAAALATFAVLLAWHSRWHWPVLILAIGYAFLMGYGRVVLGVHYPTDVLAGWLTGLACVLGAYSVLGGSPRLLELDKKAAGHQ
ncbi:phosphatase PAP2 family protein [Deinococcus sp. ZS9-10]|uniref:Phosphatase PAP2 family protein n=2 Tax=Deinococcus arenicola TaxID=2994950 RepID=A0ABU4DR14_9DEIO|nr:phosphatase PAP2 family protein [Deinococcus sp. ZS9-10]